MLRLVGQGLGIPGEMASDAAVVEALQRAARTAFAGRPLPASTA